MTPNQLIRCVCRFKGKERKWPLCARRDRTTDEDDGDHNYLYEKSEALQINEKNITKKKK